jgi:hypothetical protein
MLMTLPEYMAMSVIYAKKLVRREELVEWFLMTSEPVDMAEEASHPVMGLLIITETYPAGTTPIKLTCTGGFL